MQNATWNTCTNWNDSVPLCFDFFSHLQIYSPRPRLPWKGCWHFVEGLNLTPSSARRLEHIVKSRPSESANKPTRTEISSFSDATGMFEILSLLSNVLLRCPHTNSGVWAVAVLASAKKNHIYFHSMSQMNKTTEPWRLAQQERVVEMSFSRHAHAYMAILWCHNLFRRLNRINAIVQRKEV